MLSLSFFSLFFSLCIVFSISLGRNQIDRSFLLHKGYELINPFFPLNFTGCVRLGTFLGDIHKLKHLSLLYYDDCSKLTSFLEIKGNIGKLEFLRLDGTVIKELPSLIELLQSLHDLSLNNCKNLESLSNSFCNLSSLTTLSLDGCSKLGRLLEDLERMPCLETLSLRSVSCRLLSLSG